MFPIRQDLLTLSAEQLHSLLPYLVVFGGAIAGILLSPMQRWSSKWIVFAISIAACVEAAFLSIQQTVQPTVHLFNNMMVVDSFSGFFNLIFLGAAAISMISSLRYLDNERLQYPEYYVLMLLSSLGMMLMTAANDLIVIFISLEIMSLAVYTLVGFRRADRRSNEAAMKYFILGSAASAVMLYGSALLYGVTGTTNIRAILDVLQNSKGIVATPLFVLGAWLVISGFLFKVASVPFHMWMPDVYEGAPTPVTGFMTTGLKAASFATFVRVFISMGYGRDLPVMVQQNMHHILWVCAVLTMVIGNVVALTQTNLKRLLGYSSIAHTGYIMVGMISASGSPEGFSPVVVYLTAYTIMNLGAFAVLTILSGRNDTQLGIHDLAGLSQKNPWLAFAMATFMLSMAGIPPTAGFAAKYLLFYSAVQAGEIPLVVISVLCSAISVYYYLRVLVFMYMREPAGSKQPVRESLLATIAVAAMVALTFEVGVLPAQVIAVARRVVTSL